MNEEGTQLILDDREKPEVFFQSELKAKTGSNFKAEIDAVTSLGNGVNFDPITHSLIIGESGKYCIRANQVASASGEASLIIRKNGLGLKRAASVNAVRLNHTVSVIESCTAGDALDFYWNGTVTEAIAGMDSSVSIFRI